VCRNSILRFPQYDGHERNRWSLWVQADAYAICAAAALAFDKSGNLGLVDEALYRVLKFAAPYNSAASVVLGQGSFTRSDSNWGLSPCTSNILMPNATGFFLPQGVSIDGAGDVFVTDAGNQRVLEFSGTLASGQAAGLVLGQGKFTSNSAGTSQNAVNNLAGISTP
jgi:NHL repeat-containing protein